MSARDAGELSPEKEADLLRGGPPRKPLVGAERVAEIEAAKARIGAGMAAQIAEWQALTPEELARRKLPFIEVPFADLKDTDPAPPMYAWEGLIPIGHVSGLSAHGGVGKTFVAIQLAVSVATGRPLFGKTTRQGPAILFSGEDGQALLRYRLKFVCGAMGVNIADLKETLFILDATERDPTLFAESNIAGQRVGRSTSTYEALLAYCKLQGARLLIVDNASDAFDANENDRSRVRAFMRALARIARECDCAVLLLAHVDKGTSRFERAGTEGYSGSTAWHNSSRSRLFMRRESDGALIIEHQKHNLGALHAPIRLIWPAGGVPQLDGAGPMTQGVADRGHERAILRLIAEYFARGEHIATARNSPNHAAKVLRDEPSFPKRLKDAQVFNLLRDAERAGYLQRIEIRGSNRHSRECWQVTPAGAAFVATSDGAAF
ncbi:MAG TPA: AAA family ATPase [Ramlibacter sp.]|nr:AAA family ATPase [Ramlibacter sp.]